jgi:hypothetical protein
MPDAGKKFDWPNEKLPDSDLAVGAGGGDACAMRVNVH